MKRQYIGIISNKLAKYFFQDDILTEFKKELVEVHFIPILAKCSFANREVFSSDIYTQKKHLSLVFKSIMIKKIVN